MDINLASLGVDVGVVVGIVFIGQFVKRLLKNTDIPKKYKKWFILTPLVLSLAAAFVVTVPLAVQDFFKNLIIYTGASSYLYNGRKLFLKKEETNGTQTTNN